MSSWRSIAGPVTYELPRISGSRFLARAAPAVTADEALAVVAAARAGAPEATHHCWAYRLPPDGSIWRSADDGEPRGSAGAPILRRLQGRDLVGVIVVVTRWFGGTRLGVGGLVRAYGAAAAGVLALATPSEVVPRVRLSVRYPYASDGAVKRALATRGIEPIEAAYAADVRLVLCVPVAVAAALRTEIADLTAGQAIWG